MRSDNQLSSVDKSFSQDILGSPEEPKQLAKRIAAGEQGVAMPLSLAMATARELDASGIQVTGWRAPLTF